MNRRAYKTSVLIFLLSTCTSLGSLSLAQTFDDPFIIYSEDTIYKGSIVDNTIKDSLYYGKNITQDVYTKPDVIITDKSNIKTSNFNHAKYFEYGELREKQGKSFDLSEEFRTCSGTVGNLNDYLLNYKEQLLNVPQNMSHIMYREWYFATSDVKYNDPNNMFDTTDLTQEQIAQNISEFNKKYNTNIIYIREEGKENTLNYKLNLKIHLERNEFTGQNSYENEEGFLSLYLGTRWQKYENKNEKDIVYKDYDYTLEDVSITVSNNSNFTSNNDILTNNFIKVTNGSILQATNKIEGSTISSINSKISAKSINASKDIYADTYLKANNNIKATNINIGGVNSNSMVTTGNQSISGIFTLSGQAKLNGGAVLGNKKITKLSAGTLSASSTEAVNGSQLNTIKQKLASTGGKSYSAGSDVAISSTNAISVAKNGTVASGNTGIVTGGTVYKITSALNNSLDALKASVNSHQSTLTTLSQGLSDLKSSVTNINSSVASATKNLSSSLTTRLQSDMGNLSADGKNVIRSMVSSTLKSMNSMSMNDASTVSAIATYEANDVNDVADSDSIAAIRNDLDLKASKSDYDLLSTTVASNTKAISTNEDSIQKNTTAISDLKSTKADVDGSNISADGYADKLGVGKVESGNTGLVSGDSVYGALDKKADVGYVVGGLSMVSAQLNSMSQRMTADMNRVGAGASALAGLHPASYDASDKLSFASGYGHYKNANTSALGAFYHPNEKTMVSVAGTIGNKDAMLSAGVSIKVGMGDHVSKVIVTPKMFSVQEVTNQSIRDRVDTQAKRIRQIEMALQSR